MAKKVLGQVVPSASSLTDLMAAPLGVAEMALVSNIQVCNQGTATTNIRIAFCDKDDSDDPKHYILYGWPLGAKDSFYYTGGLILPPDWEMRVWSSQTNVSFSAWGDLRTDDGTLKCFGQLKPSAQTLSTLATIAASKEVVLSTLCACNQGSSSDLVRVAIRPAGASIDPKHYLYYDFSLPGNSHLEITSGIALAATDVVSVYSYGGNVSFNAFGMEVSA